MTLLRVKLATARAVGGLARRAGRGGGTSLPGKVLMALEPEAISELAGRLPQGSVVVSATNGKTTTTAMIASVLERAGVSLVHNRAGANMAGGVASTLLSAARRGDDISGDLGLFEIDEFWLDQITPQLQPRAVLLGNLFRDQLDRYGELETIADRWAGVVAALPPTARLVLNADDPLIADLGRHAPNVTYFGVEDPSVAMPEMQHASDSKHCRRCGAAYSYEAIYLGHLGRYRCPNCGQERPAPKVAAEQISLDGTRGSSFEIRTPTDSLTVKLPLPGLYNVYNALGAAALCLELDMASSTAWCLRRSWIVRPWSSRPGLRKSRRSRWRRASAPSMSRWTSARRRPMTSPPALFRRASRTTKGGREWMRSSTRGSPQGIEAL